MGTKLLEFYAQADVMGGLPGKMRLAVLAKMTSTQAETAPDNPTNIAKLTAALAALKEEYTRGPVSAPALRRPADESLKASEARLRLHNRVLAELLGQRALFLGDVDKTVAHMTEAAASTLDVARVSVWFYDSTRTSIRCADLFERRPPRHTSGTELFARDFPAYFKALTEERTIAAHDAHRDPRTSVFSAPYLTPLGITSMLDVPIWTNSRMVGVVCHEHTGPARTWNADEETFAYMMGSFVALALERKT